MLSRPTYLGIFLLSMGSLAFEITLTRLFSVIQWYHFAFMAVSIALLGFGASGSFLSLFPTLAGRDVTRLLTILSILFALSVVGGYLTINYIPFDSYRIAWERRQFLYLAVYYLSLTAPFFCSGLAVGVLLAARPDLAAVIYSFNLGGSALGCLAAVVALPFLGGAGMVMLAALLGALAALAFLNPRLSSGVRPSVSGLLSLALVVVLLLLIIRPLAFLEVRMSPYKGLSSTLHYPGARLVFSRWNAFSRVDVAESEGIHSAPGLSLVYPGTHPPQLALFTDGENLSPITNPQSEALAFIDYLPVALPYLLRPGARAMIIEPKGGLDVLVALRKGVASALVVENNPLIVEVVRDRFGEWDGHLYDDERVRVVVEDGRSYVHRTEERFDIIQVSLADTFKPVTSGAYSLAENYLYTRQAFTDYLRHLNQEGLLVISRWLQLPPSESLRAWGLAVTALEESGVSQPAQCLVALRSWSTALLLVKNTPFSAADLDTVRTFCEEKRFDLIYTPDLRPEEINRYNVLPEPYHYHTFRELLTHPRRGDFYAAYPFDVSPPDDDRPFFFHLFKWSQTPAIVRDFGRVWQPFGGSGYFVLVALLILALLACLVLILLPLLALRKTVARSPHKLPIFLYFTLLGLGYLFVEIPLLPHFVLFLGHPLYAFAAVLFSLLLFSGLGSLVSARFPLPLALAALSLTILVYPLALPYVFRVLLGQSLIVRLGVSLVSLAPLGFLMGMPFPGGIALVDEVAPALIPWAWGINGCASVLSSILSMMLAISFGFSWVLRAASLAYAGGLIVVLWLRAQ